MLTNRSNDTTTFKGSSSETVTSMNKISEVETEGSVSIEKTTVGSSSIAMNNWNDRKKKLIRKGKSSIYYSQRKPKIIWTNSLHNHFLEALRIIGLDRAVPKRILEVMNVPGLTRENVASHLQKYRIFLKRVSDASIKMQNRGVETPSVWPCGAVSSPLSMLRLPTEFPVKTPAPQCVETSSIKSPSFISPQVNHSLAWISHPTPITPINSGIIHGNQMFNDHHTCIPVPSVDRNIMSYLGFPSCNMESMKDAAALGKPEKNIVLDSSCCSVVLSGDRFSRISPIQHDQINQHLGLSSSSTSDNNGSGLLSDVVAEYGFRVQGFQKIKHQNDRALKCDVFTTSTDQRSLQNEQNGEGTAPICDDFADWESLLQSLGKSNNQA